MNVAHVLVNQFEVLSLAFRSQKWPNLDKAKEELGADGGVDLSELVTLYGAFSGQIGVKYGLQGATATTKKCPNVLKMS